MKIRGSGPLAYATRRGGRVKGLKGLSQQSSPTYASYSLILDLNLSNKTAVFLPIFLDDS